MKTGYKNFGAYQKKKKKKGKSCHLFVLLNNDEVEQLKIWHN